MSTESGEIAVDDESSDGVVNSHTSSERED